MGELEQWMDENYLRQLWWSYGEEITCRISIDKYGSTYAFIDFQSHEGAGKLLQTLNGTQIPNTNSYFKLNWSNRDGNGVPIVNNAVGGGAIGGAGFNMNGDFSIFVGDLGPDVDDNVLLAAFQSRYASICSAKVMMDPVTGYTRGFGFVRFFDETEQQRALEEMQGVYVGSRPIRVSVARARAKFDVGLGPHTPESEISTVFVGGLNNTITEEELRAYFGTCGNIIAVKIIPNKNIAFIQYLQRSSAEQSIAELNGSHLGGAKLRLSFGRTQLNAAPTAGYYQPPIPVGYMNQPYQAMAPPPAPVIIPPPELIDPKKPFQVEIENDKFMAFEDELSNASHRIDGKSVHVEFIRNMSIEHNFVWETAMLFPRSFSMGFMKSPKVFVEGWLSTERDLKFEFNYTLRRVSIFFTHLGEEYKVEYKFKDVDGEMYAEKGNNVTIFTIPLRHPGVFWKRNQEVLSETKNSSKRGKQWERVTLIPLDKDSDITTQQKTPFLPVPHPNALDLGNWLTYRLVFHPSPKHAQEFERKLKGAADFNLVPRDSGWKKPFIDVVKIGDLPKPLDHKQRCDLNMHFDVLYMIESCISYHYLNEFNLDVNFYDILMLLKPGVACGILQIISNAKQRIWNPEEELYKIFERVGMKVQQRRSVPDHCALLRKIIVTPSHIYIQTPSVETTNRVIRHYKDQSEGFIRVQFMDEGFNRVGAGHSNMTKESIYTRIFTILRRGVQIGKKRYEFLAFSSSQLREQGCWFFAPTRETNATDIRGWMGVFSHEKVVAKHAVRMGQCFSSTRPVYTLEPEEVEYIDDVKRFGYTFSDGVGKISPSLAKEVAIRLDLKMEPSAFQFRLGGAKGVLTIDKRLVDTQVKVQLRPSQIKFESKHLTLEVIRTSTYIHSYLNRQAITLLSALGIKDHIFLDLMNEMLQDVDRLFSKPEEAIRVLQGNVDEAGTALFMVPLIQAGFLERGDPYIKNLLNLFRVNILKDLKKKAKIVVPKGAFLLGVMDETGILEEGEIFVQINDISANRGMSKEIITGDVVVFRNPCFHPGDIRIVKAVDREELHYLVDVVVFSSKGARDIPSMCSGGDLDGDDYTIYWDPRLIPSSNYVAMDYTPAPPKLVDDVKIKDILKFFVNYINNDNLGQIANAHLATADQSAVGARDGKCIRLAQLHSEAVGK
ncbi:RNA dependent RNA polymerase-domain-containing protein [Parasitella parasitica]|nr:RNA dependent RNA polymerase-domain-containing protein [Parasitella parasitica]